MVDEGSSSTLILVAAILQLIFMFIGVALTGFFLLGLVLFMSIDPSLIYLPSDFNLEGLIAGNTIFFLYFGTGTILALVFMILWFIWRSHPSQHRIALIITGIIGLIMAGFLPGLLALIGGIIAPSPDAVQPFMPTRQPKIAAPLKYCQSCGTPITNPTAQFCGNCGAPLG